jgi:hypothetical protein
MPGAREIRLEEEKREGEDGDQHLADLKAAEENWPEGTDFKNEATKLPKKTKDLICFR